MSGRPSATRARAGIALGILGLLCCAPGDERLAVRGRLAERAALPPLRAEPRAVGTEIREAPALPASSQFEVDVRAADRELAFAIAASGPEACRESIRFRIEGRAGELWQPLFEAELAAGLERWQEHRLRLPEAAASRLRFSTRALGASACAEPLWGSVLFLGPPPRRERSLPNVVLISLDTLGAAYLGAFGGPTGVSPNLDAFLAGSFSFERAYAQYGVTRTSHASLFTALYPLRHGAYPFAAVRPLDSLVPPLAARGYLTVAFTEGGFVSGALGFQEGFDRYDDSSSARQNPAHTADAAETFRRALDWLARDGVATRFFLFLHTYEVHLPYRVRDAASRELLARLWSGPPGGLHPLAQARSILRHNEGSERLSADELAHLRALYSAEIHHLDRELGIVLGRLESLGLAERTLVVLTADHGEQFGEQGKAGHGESLHNRVLQVPLGFRWPGVVRAGSEAAPVQLVDVMPTILDLLGIAPPADRDGHSLVPQLRGEPRAERPAFAELRGAAGECVQLRLEPGCRLDRYAVQTGRFKLVRSGVPPGEMLYDLADDPLESRDVAAEHPAELARHRALLDAYRRAGGEPEEAPALEADQRLREQLRALGYLE